MNIFKKIKHIIKKPPPPTPVILPKLNIGNYIPNSNGLFIHIPKNAGTTIVRSFGLEHSNHATALELYNKLGGNIYTNYFSFCFVRNPWERFFSLYNYARMEESYYHSSINPEKAPYGKHLDYDLLKNASLLQCAHYLIEGKLIHDHSWNHWLPQTNWVLDNSNRPIVQYIGRLENIDTDLMNIQKKLNINKDNIPQKIQKINSSSNNKDYRVHFDNETFDIISKYYQSDIVTFSYKFE